MIQSDNNTLLRQHNALMALAKNRGVHVYEADLTELRMDGCYIPHPPSGRSATELVWWLLANRKRKPEQVLAEQVQSTRLPVILLQKGMPLWLEVRTLAHEMGHALTVDSTPRLAEAMESAARAWAKEFLTDLRWATAR